MCSTSSEWHCWIDARAPSASITLTGAAQAEVWPSPTGWGSMSSARAPTSRATARPENEAPAITTSAERGAAVPLLLPDIALAEELLQFLVHALHIVQTAPGRHDVFVPAARDDVYVHLPIARVIQQILLQLLDLLARAHPDPERRAGGRRAVLGAVLV